MGSYCKNNRAIQTKMWLNSDTYLNFDIKMLERVAHICPLLVPSQALASGSMFWGLKR